jgi:hypothetical protein
MNTMTKEQLETARAEFTRVWNTVQTAQEVPNGWRERQDEFGRRHQVLPTSNTELSPRLAHCGERCVCGKKLTYAVDVKLPVAVAEALRCDDQMTVGQECVAKLPHVDSYLVGKMKDALARLKFEKKHSGQG